MSSDKKMLVWLGVVAAVVIALAGLRWAETARDGGWYDASGIWRSTR